jgi:hypothetical protein
VLFGQKEVAMQEYLNLKPPQTAQPIPPLQYAQPVYPLQQQAPSYIVQPPPYLVQPVYVQPAQPLTWWRLMPWGVKVLFILGMLALACIIIFFCAGLLHALLQPATPVYQQAKPVP